MEGHVGYTGGSVVDGTRGGRGPLVHPVAPAGGGVGSILNDVLFGRKGPRGGQQSKGMVEAAATIARSNGSDPVAIRS